MPQYLILRNDGEEVGSTVDEHLAEEIDGLELTNDALDPAYEEEYTYTVKEI